MITLATREFDQPAPGGAAASPDTSVDDPCPLCACTGARVVETIAYDEIWSALEREWGVSITDDVRRKHAPVPVTVLVECDACDLHFFRPLLPGDQAFYAELMERFPYEPSRWEHDVVAEGLGPADRVMDLGCGDGAFIRRISLTVARAVGLDHNL